MEDKKLPESSASYDGGTNGAMANTSKADLKRGFSLPKVAEPDSDETNTKPKGGFCGRPTGMER